MPRFQSVLLVAGLWGCGGGGQVFPDASPSDAGNDDAAAPALPLRISQTGLYAGGGIAVVADDVFEYQVGYPLWSDAADKRRFIRLPAGSQINVSNPDFWRFPTGTQTWKEFSSEGTLLETRYMVKTGPFREDWEMASYLWNSEQTDADLVLDGAINVHGTTFDVPAAEDCNQCHRNVRDTVIGFTGIQLNHDLPGLNLGELESNGQLSDDLSIVSFDIPGDEDAAAALGYLHGNCAHCHNDNADTQGVSLRLWLTTDGLASPEETAPYVTAIGALPVHVIDGATAVVAPGLPAESALFLRMNTRGIDQMPPLATELIDASAVDTVGAWISSLPTD